jgi:Carboxypeptidase regulatory-like domain
MLSKQKSKLSMSMAARDYLLQNATVTTTLPNFTNYFTSIQSAITQIQSIAELQDFEKTGITDNKSQLRISLCGLAADYSRKLVAYATFTSNAVLLKEVKISESDLKRLADVDLKSEAQALYDRAQANLAGLATYGISAGTQTSLQTAITNFNASIPKPRLGINEKKQATQQLNALFKTLDAAWENIDLDVDIVRLTQVNFYNGYRTARKIINTASSTLAVKAKVTDAVSGKPVKNVTVEFLSAQPMAMTAQAVNDTKSSPIISKRTAIKGGIQVKSLPAGTYQVRVKKVGYADVITTVDVNDNEMSVLNVALAKM